MGTFCFKVQKEALCLTTFLNFQKRVLSAHALQKERKCAQSERAYTTTFNDGADENALSLSLSLSLGSIVSGITNVYAFLSLLVLFHLFVLWLKTYMRAYFLRVKPSLCSEISLFLSDHLAPAT
jgi:hypothetical protein